MAKTGTTPPARKRWRWIALGTLGLVGAVGGWFALRYTDRLRAQTQPAAAPVANTAVLPVEPDQRVVGFLNNSDAVTREELAEYLILRHGNEKLDAVVNRRIIDLECAARGITVTAAEVETALAESIRDLGIDHQRFLKDYLKGIHKNLFEWKEDVLRPKLMLTKLCRDGITVTQEELLNAFEAQYGEKVECRLIIWPEAKKAEAYQSYGSLRDSEEAFARMAKTQNAGPLASTGGKIRPVGRHTLSDQHLEEVIFRLRPGEVSELVLSPDGKTITLVKCDGRVPADTTRTMETVREELTKTLFERKVAFAAGNHFKMLRDQARITPALPLPQDMTALLRKPGPPGQVLATIHNNVPITRRDLGEHLIARYGAESMEMLLNRKIIEKACAAHAITVSDQEVEAAYRAELDRYKVDEKMFVEKVLQPNGTTIFQWKEDVMRPKLMMTKLVGAQVKVTDDELKKAYNAYYGETIQGRLIVWQPNGALDILKIYTDLRDNEAKFDAAARKQFNPALAARAGMIPPFARNTTGYPLLEEEAFKLHPGQVSKLIESPEGLMLFKCDNRLPPKKTKTFEDARAELMPIAREQLIEKTIPVVFEQMKTQANPKSLLKDGNQVEDLAASTREALAPPTPPNIPGLAPRAN